VRKIYFVLITLVCLMIGGRKEMRATSSGETGSRCPSTNSRNILKTIWNYQQPQLTKTIGDGLGTSKDSQVLYNIQVFTNNLLEMSAKCSDTETLQGLVKLYLVTYPYLTLSPNGHLEWVCDHTGCAGYSGQPVEVLLYSSQFVYLLSRTVDILTGLPQSSLTPEMSDFLQKYVPVINDHLHKWISGSGTNQHLLLEKLLRRGYDTPFKNRVEDKSMWIIAASAEMLAANYQSPTLIPLSQIQKTELHDHVDLGTRLIQGRLAETSLTDFGNHSVVGYDFDRGLWQDYTDQAYCGYTGPTFPTEADKSTCPTVGWDLSHARRYVNVFSTLHDTRAATGQSFPDDTVLTKLANQVVYKVFNKDFNQPLFSNYWDGNNGWHRVNYANQMGFGYAPDDLSISFPTGGYGFWGKYNPDIDKIMQSVWSVIDSTDPETVAFRNTHYGTMYINYQHSSKSDSDFSKTYSVNLLMMLPTMGGIGIPTPTITNSLCTQCSNQPEVKAKGDADCSGTTTINDASIWRVEFIEGQMGTVSRTTWKADFDCNGRVTLNDFSIWRQNFINSI
jgi:hypothetical protein